MDSGKSGEKSHNEGENVGRDRISKQPLQDSPPQQHSPLTYHYQSHICLPICNERVKIVLPTFDA